MDNREKIKLYKNLNRGYCDDFVNALEAAGDTACNYYDYLASTENEIDCDKELLRLPEADYKLCCVLLTMLVREDHFSNGSFEYRYRMGQVKPIVEKMIKLLMEETEMGENKKGYIYIFTNPSLQGMVKIGYTDNVERRRKQLSTTSLPTDYEVYATYEVIGQGLEDKKLHKIIDDLSPDMRVNKSREFFVMSREAAYKLLENIAIISGTTNRLSKPSKESEISKELNERRKGPFTFSMCKIKPGEIVEYIRDSSIKAKVVDDKHVEYQDQIMSLSSLAIQLSGKPGIHIAGPKFFKYKGKVLSDMRKELEK